MGPRVKPHVFVASIVLLVAGLALVPSMSRAQDTLGDVVYPLNDLTAPDKMSTPMAGMASTPMAGGNMGKVVAQSSTKIETSLDDLLGADYALNVHLSAEKIDVYIACGNVKGTPKDQSCPGNVKYIKTIAVTPETAKKYYDPNLSYVQSFGVK